MQQNKRPQRTVPSVDAEETKDPDDQSWFWTPSWQAGEAEADRDIAEGRVTDLTPEEIQARIRALDSHTRP